MGGVVAGPGGGEGGGAISLPPGGGSPIDAPMVPITNRPLNQGAPEYREQGSPWRGAVGTPWERYDVSRGP